MKEVLFVALGGAVGSVMRFLVASLSSSISNNDFPITTLFINVLGCLLIGAVYTNWHASSAFAWIKPLLMIGILGGFTTFSTFGFEVFQLWKNKQISMAIAYLVLSNTLGFVAVWIGSSLQFKA